MKDFIELTRFSEGTKFLVALHTISKVSPASMGKDKSYASVTLSFGKSGQEPHSVRETYEEVKKLIQEAQSPSSENRLTTEDI